MALVNFTWAVIHTERTWQGWLCKIVSYMMILMTAAFVVLSASEIFQNFQNEPHKWTFFSAGDLKAQNIVVAGATSSAHQPVAVKIMANGTLIAKDWAKSFAKRLPSVVRVVKQKAGNVPTFPLNPKARLGRITKPHNVSDLSIWVHDPRECRFISRSILKFNHWSWHLMQNVLEAVKPSPDCLFVDVGANIGAFSLVMAKLGFSVASFEPMPYNLELFRQSIIDNNLSRAITVHEVAVGDKETDKPVCMEPAQMGDPEHNQGNGRISENGTVCVPLRRIDDLLANRCPEAVKVDVEGFEGQALRGMGIPDKCLPRVVVLEYIRIYTARTEVGPFVQLGPQYICHGFRKSRREFVASEMKSPRDGDYLCKLRTNKSVAL